jgi:hypothetical protein
VETILDWRPFDYYTFENLTHAGRESWMDFLNTYSFEVLPDGQGTCVHAYMKFKQQTMISRIVVGTGLFKMIMNTMLQKVMAQMEMLMKEAVDQQAPAIESSAAIAAPSGA